MDLPGAWLLLAPAGLLGLLAIAIPVAIHLISRGRGRRVLIGNIELVRAARRTRVTAPRLTEWLLLLLRVMIFVVATLLLARLALQGMGSVDAGVRYVTPGWLSAATDAERSELLAIEPAARVLAAGYPRAAEHEPVIPDPDYDIWPLLAERLSTLRHSGTVDVYAGRGMATFGMHRPRLPNDINWRLAAAARPDALVSRGALIHDGNRGDDLQRVERALAAVKRHRVPQLAWEECLAADTACMSQPHDWLVWLAAAEPPQDLQGVPVYRPGGPAWQQATTDPRYPEVLLDALLGEEERYRAWQRIPVNADVLTAGAESPGSIPLPHRPLHAWLGLLLAALWGVERLVSERRRTENG